MKKSTLLLAGLLSLSTASKADEGHFTTCLKRFIRRW